MSAPLDLAALARERMARQQAASRKRPRSISPPPPRNQADITSSTTSLPSGARLTSFSTVVKLDQQGRKPDVANAANEHLQAPQPQSNESGKSENEPVLAPCPGTSRPGDVIYPQGIVKRTWAFGHARCGDDIKIEEVLEPQTLRTAVLSAFQWDTEWVFSKLKVPPNGGSTKCVFVMQAKDESVRKQIRAETEGMRSWLRLCFPPMEGQTNCMHSKLMLLFHPKKLRIAMPTANLLNFDWGETGLMENSVYIIDLPRFEKGQGREDSNVTSTPFGQELLHFLQAQGLDQDVRDSLQTVDFSATVNMAFIHTAGGKSIGADAERTGVAGLSRAVRQLGLVTENVQIDFAASSIGNLKDDYLRLIHAASKGIEVFEYSTKVAAKATAVFKSTRPDHSIRDNIRIYFPTHDTVTNSTAGAVGTICISREWFEDMAFPRRCFRDYISTRPGLVSHNKLMYVRGTSKGAKIAWVYVGSANMSQSAWGQLVYNKKDKKWHINCRNWECGVLLPVMNEPPSPKAEDSDTEDEQRPEDVVEAARKSDDYVDMNVFDEVAKPPFRVPAPEYQNKEPWYFKEQRRV